jgi:uncharacterized protein YjbI with pentapeptide repeats
MKSREQCLRQAEELSRAHPYFKWTHIEALAGWCRYGDRCVYCGKPLLNNWETVVSSAHTDHLLPRKYTEIEWDDLNLVLCCTTCNCLKADYDANPDVAPELRYTGGQITEAQHTAILEACRREVSRRRAERQAHIETALVQWRRLNENRQQPSSDESSLKNSHLRILLSGKAQWDLARQQRPTTNPDLQGVDLKGRDLKHFDFRGANLTRADLSEANLALADFDATFRERVAGKTRGADLSRANLSGANLRMATLKSAVLNQASLRNANLEKARVDGADLTGCDLRGADLSTVEGLTHEQIATALIDESTKLPPYLSF